MFRVARRVRPPKGLPALPMVIGRQLEEYSEQQLEQNLLALYGDESLAKLYRGKKFVMSLSEGEMISARRGDKQPDDPHAIGYFVVVKLDRKRIHFASHWDARKEKQQDRWSKSPAGLRDLGPSEGTSPAKVHVDPLGTVRMIFD